jgi:hypothetical protein
LIPPVLKVLKGVSERILEKVLEKNETDAEGEKCAHSYAAVRQKSMHHNNLFKRTIGKRNIA